MLANFNQTKHKRTQGSASQGYQNKKQKAKGQALQKECIKMAEEDQKQHNADKRRNNKIERGGDQRNQEIDPAVKSVKMTHRGDCSQLEIHKNDNHYRGSSPKALRSLSGLK